MRGPHVGGDEMVREGTGGHERTGEASHGPLAGARGAGLGAGEVHTAQFVLPPNHSVMFVWDNGKSFFGSRHVHYKFQVEDFDTKEA